MPTLQGRSLRNISLIAKLLFILQFHSVSSASCSEELGASGWPRCASPCFPICDKYCPSALVDPLCTCSTPAYTRETYACLQQSCSDGDLQYINKTTTETCASFGQDITRHLSSTVSSFVGTSPTSTSPVGTTSAVASDGNQAGAKKGVPVPTVVGIALGIGLGLLLGAAAIWFCMRRRKKKRMAAQAPVVGQALHIEAKHNLQPQLHQPMPPPGPPAVVGPYPPIQNWENSPRQPELQGMPMNNANATPAGQSGLPEYRTEMEANRPGNAPGWKPPHELG
jgi:hypothetical protein